MKRYERYKDSGIKWIGEIPEHWKTKKIKYVFTERSEKGFPNEPVLCSTQKYGVIPQSLYENRVVVVNKGLENLKRVRKGDFVISLRSFQGGIEYAYYQGIISAAYTILQLTDTANSDYLKYIFKSLDFIQLLKTCVTGIREGQNINYELLRKNSIPLPPLNEQTIIVSYLDKKISEIDSYVEKRKKLIASLSELKQSVIAKAVTKGLNPNVPMKYSGITWIGMIPEHWELKKIRNFTKMISIKGYGDMALLSVTREKGVIERNIDDKDENHNYIPDDLSGYKLVKKGQFVINKMKSWQGSYGVSDYNGIVSPAYYVCDLDFPCKAYFSIAIRSKAYIPFFTQYSKGIRVGQWDLSPIGLKNIPFIIPPREEQQAIVDYLNRKINKIEAYKKSLLSEIDYIKQFHS